MKYLFTILLTLIYLSTAYSADLVSPRGEADMQKVKDILENGLTANPDEIPMPQAGEKYILFNNMDPDYVNVCYYNPVNNLTDYKGQVLSTSFSDQTFAQYNITDFDVAIFPMGSLPLSAATTGGIKIIDKINEMIVAGKEVMIIGWQTLSLEFDASSGAQDEGVRNLFENIMNIDYQGLLPQHYREGNTAYLDSFLIVGSRNNNIPDSVSRGLTLHCNGGLEGYAPLAYALWTETFQVTDEQSKGIFHYDSPNNPNLAGMRINLGDARILLLTFGFEVISGTLKYESLMEGSMDWLTAPDYEPGALFEYLSPTRIDMGVVDPGASKDGEVTFANIGAKPMEISNISFLWNEEGAFSITEGGNFPLTVEPGETHTIKFRFQPPAESPYTVFLLIENNSDNITGAEFRLDGSGGKKFGAHFSTNIPDNIIDFGYVEKFSSKKVTLLIQNTGINDLEINYYDFDRGDDESFEIIVNDFFPVTVGGNSTHEMVVRFVPVVEGKTYRGSIEFNTNASNENIHRIELIGREGEPLEAFLTTDLENQNMIDFGRAEVNEMIEVEFNIGNTGSIPLLVNGIEASTVDGDVFDVEHEFETPINIPVDSNVTVTATFTPDEASTQYGGKLTIHSNAINGNVYEITLTGESDAASSVEPIGRSNDGTLVLTASPNPAQDYLRIEARLNGNISRSISIRMLDMSGREVHEFYNGILNPGSRDIELNTGAVPSGMYFIVADYGNEAVKLPVIISK